MIISLFVHAVDIDKRYFTGRKINSPGITAVQHPFRKATDGIWRKPKNYGFWSSTLQVIECRCSCSPTIRFGVWPKHNLVSTINRKHIGKTKRSPAEIIKNHKTGYRNTNEDVW